MKSIAPSLLLAYSTFTSATTVHLYPRFSNATSSITNTTTPSNATFIPPPCFTITEMRKVIPSCALSCQTLALKADACPYEDTACHCANTAAISAVVEPCLAVSNCSVEEVTAFAAIVMPTCAFFNATTNGTMPASCKLPADDDSDYGAPSSYDEPAYNLPPPPPPPSTTSIPSKPVVTGYDYPAPPPVSTTTTIPAKPVITSTSSIGYGYPAPPPPVAPVKPVTTSSLVHSYGYEYPANASTPSAPIATGAYNLPPPPSNVTVTGYGYAKPTGGYNYPSISTTSHKSTGMAIVPTKSSVGAASSTPVPYTAGASMKVVSLGSVVVASVVVLLSLL